MNAHARLIPTPEEKPVGQVLPDGSLLITAEELGRLGNGDAKRGRRELRLLLEAERDPVVLSGPVERPASVRIATPKDEKDILDLALLDLRENAPPTIPVHEDVIMAYIRMATQKKGAIIGLIDGPDKKPVAVCMLLPSKWWFSKAHYVTEALNYVHPDHRKTKHIHDLIQFERWAGDAWSREAGFIVHILFSVLGGKRVKEKVILYKRKVKQAGALFLYPSPSYGDET